MRLSPVAHWEPLWPVVGPMLAPSIERGDAPLGDILEALAIDHAQLWIAHQAETVWMAMVTQRTADDALHIWHVGGRDSGLWLHLVDDLKAHARVAGLTKLTTEGRKGLRRLLAKHGFVAVGDLLEAGL